MIKYYFIFRYNNHNKNEICWQRIVSIFLFISHPGNNFTKITRMHNINAQQIIYFGIIASSWLLDVHEYETMSLTYHCYNLNLHNVEKKENLHLLTY